MILWYFYPMKCQTWFVQVPLLTMELVPEACGVDHSDMWGLCPSSVSVMAQIFPSTCLVFWPRDYQYVGFREMQAELLVNLSRGF